jgi:hypothetical protein
MAETVCVEAADEDADRLYHEFLKWFGLDSVGCQACARALLPAPFNLESYTFTARGGASWTWDVAFARSLVSTRDPRSEPVLLEAHDLASWLEHCSQVDEAHLAHIPADWIQEPVLLAPVPDGQGQVMVDGSHRAAVRVRAGLPVHAHLLTEGESELAISVVPLTIRSVYRALRASDLLPNVDRR